MTQWGGNRFVRSGTTQQPITVSNYPNQRAVIRGTYTGDQYYGGVETAAFDDWNGKIDYVRIIGQDLSEARALPEPTNPVILGLKPWESTEDRMSSKGIIFVEHWNGIISFKDSSHWEVSGVESYGNGEFCIYSKNGSSAEWYVHDIVCHRNDEHGIQLNGDYNRIENNEVYHSAIHGNASVPGGNTNGGFGISVLGNHNIISKNIIHDIVNGGILFEEIMGKNAGDNVVEYNILHNTFWGITDIGGDGNIIRNNIIYSDQQRTERTGIWITRYWGNTDPKDNKIYNNTILGTFSDGAVVLQNDTNTDLRNNIFLTWDGKNTLRGSPAIQSNNLKSGLISSVFQDATTGNLHLQANSPAIDVGTSLGTCINPVMAATELCVWDDYEGVLRPQGSAPDIGAYEYRIGTPGPTQAPTSTPTSIPGDANSDHKVDEQDYAIWLDHYNQQTDGGSGVGDFDNNGKVDGIDYVIWLNNYQ